MSDDFLKQMRAAEQEIRTKAQTLGVEVDVNIHTGMVDMRCGQKRWSFRGLLTAQIALEVATEVRLDRHFDLLPQHSPGCSNQNVLNPIGKYVGAAECGCQKGAA